MAVGHTELDIVRTDLALTVTLLGASEGAYRLPYPTFAPPVGMLDNTLLRTLPAVPSKWDLSIDIRGTSAVNAHTLLQTLLHMLQSPILDSFTPDTANEGFFIRYAPRGSTRLGVAYVLRVEDITLPTVFEDVGTHFNILGLRVKLLTTGGFFTDTTQTTLTGNLDPLNIQTVPIASSILPSLLDVRMETPVTPFAVFPADGMVHHLILNPGPYGSTTQFRSMYLGSFGGSLDPDTTTITDTANNPPAGVSVVRFTPTVANVWRTLAIGHTSLYFPGSKSVRVYLLCRANNNSGFRARIQVVTGLTVTWRSAAVGIPFNAGNAQLVYLGNYSHPFASQANSLYFIRVEVASNVASGTLDSLHTLIVAEYPETSILSYILRPPSGFSTAINHSLFANEKTNRPVLAQVANAGGAVSTSVSLLSKPYLYTRGDTVVFFHYTPSGTLWRALANAATVQFRYRFTRKNYVVIPGG